MPEDRKVDEDWKEEARREKERLARELEGKARPGGEAAPPEADFSSFVAGLATQALIHLSDMENPVTKERGPDLAAARYHIDLLGVLAEKTKGNLTPDEEKGLASVLTDLRMRYVELAGGKAPAGGEERKPPIESP